ncbi:MAG TPA: LysR substrate-binding domain-containing protein [Ferrovibrio sp.]|uniref:LysR substrate-binding domain-containing protein n=1 Tax=Ferrovibrio sp. TaxID=1917215 RepID=UPI002ED42D07
MAQDFDIDLLRAFVAVAETGGFTRAAAKLNRTQSTISQQVQRLEQAANAQLLLRDTRSLQLTEEGDRMLAYARRLLSLHDEARAAIGGVSHSGEVRLGVAEDFATLSLPKALAEFSRVHPKLHLSVVCDLSVALLRRFRQGELDLVVVKQLPEDRSGERLRVDPLVWLAGPGFTLDRDEPVPLCLFPPGCLFRDRVTAALDEAGRPWRIVYTSPSIAGLQAAVAAGIGLSILTAASDRGNLKAVDHRALRLPKLGDIALVSHVATGKRAAAAQDLARFIARSAQLLPARAA